MNEERFLEWKRDPITLAVFTSLREEATETMNSIVVYATADETAMRAAEKKGHADGLRDATEHVPEWARRET